MTRYSHAYTIAFEIISNKEDASDVTALDLLQSLYERGQECVRQGEMHEACGDPFDTQEVENDQR